jgi:hypothetical protein
MLWANEHLLHGLHIKEEVIMKKLPLSLLIVVFLGVVSACSSDSEADLPTLVPTIAPVESVVTEEPTLPPTTDTIEEQNPEAPTDDAGTSGGANFARPTLPPTWTPMPEPSETPTATPIIPTITPFVPVNNTLPSGCDVFDVDFANTDTEFLIGASPTVTWIATPGATQYRVTVANANGLVIKDDIYLSETTYTFPADYFEEGQFYGWTVIPLDADGVQMCYLRGGELIPIRPLGS